MEGEVREFSERRTWLSGEQLRHAEASVWLAGQEGIASIPDALRFYAEHGKSGARAPVLPDAVAEYIGIKTAEGCSPKTTYTYESTLRRFAQAYPDRRPNDVTAEEITAYVARWANRTTRRSAWTVLRSFYGWCWRRRYVLVNPVLLMGKMRPGLSSARYVLSPAEARQVLSRVKDTDEIAFWALSLFAGLRSIELGRLHEHPAVWSIIRLESGVIDMPEEICKTSARIVPILPVLRPWLREIRRRNLPILPPNHFQRYLRHRIAIFAGRNPEMPPESEAEMHRSSNLGRRSFISYRLAMAGASYAQVAGEVGNSEELLVAYYRQRVSRKDAQEYFSLTPGRVRASGEPGEALNCA